MSGPKPHPPGEEAGDDGDDFDRRRDSGDGLTYLDCYAVLSAGGLGGKNGFTLQQFTELSDRQLLALLSIEWDDDGHLVTEASKRRTGKEPSGSIAAAGRELPTLESLGLSEQEVRELLSLKPNVDEIYLSMFWQVWANRGKNKDEIKSRWEMHLASEN